MTTELQRLIDAVRAARATESWRDLAPEEAATERLADYLLAHVASAAEEARLNEIRGDFANWLNTPREPESQTQYMLKAIDFLLSLKDPFYPGRYDDDAEEKRDLERNVVEAYRNFGKMVGSGLVLANAQDALTAHLVSRADDGAAT